MHAFLVTFTSKVEGTSLLDPMRQGIPGLKQVPGLVMKTYLYTGPHELASLYMFTDHAAAQAYLNSETFQRFIKAPPFSNVGITHFDVVDDLSAELGTPTTPLADR